MESAPNTPLIVETGTGATLATSKYNEDEIKQLVADGGVIEFDAENTCLVVLMGMPQDRIKTPEDRQKMLVNYVPLCMLPMGRSCLKMYLPAREITTFYRSMTDITIDVLEKTCEDGLVKHKAFKAGLIIPPVDHNAGKITDIHGQPMP